VNGSQKLRAASKKDARIDLDMILRTTTYIRRNK